MGGSNLEKPSVKRPSSAERPSTEGLNTKRSPAKELPVNGLSNKVHEGQPAKGPLIEGQNAKEQTAE